MRYNLAPAGAPWFEHLVDSVDALGAAAREWRIAHQDADVAQARMQDRSDPHGGKVTGQPDPSVLGWEGRPFARSPHMVACLALETLYRETWQRTRLEYEEAALLYASGAAWAIRAVRAGERPERVVFAARRPHRVLLPGEYGPGIEALREDHYGKVDRLDEAYTLLLRCREAHRIAEEIGDQDYISDQDDATAALYSAIAEGTADAAVAYGHLLRDALVFVLLGPRQEARKERARAAEQAAAEASPEVAQ